MKTVGQILKESREEKLYSLEQVEKITKIRKELLEALEGDDYHKLPPATFVQGFIKNYAKFLELDEEKLLAIFRRGFEDKKQKAYIMDAFANPLEDRKLKITPGRILGVMVALIILTFFGYLWFQYSQFVGNPNLTLSSPQDQITLENSQLLVEGKTDPEVKISVNSQEIPVSPEGNFKQEITISSQVNKIQVVATSKFGQKTEVERIVYLKGN